MKRERKREKVMLFAILLSIFSKVRIIQKFYYFSSCIPGVPFPEIVKGHLGLIWWLHNCSEINVLFDFEIVALCYCYLALVKSMTFINPRTRPILGGDLAICHKHFHFLLWSQHKTKRQAKVGHYSHQNATILPPTG